MRPVFKFYKPDSNVSVVPAQLFAATHAAALEQHVVEIEGAVFLEGDEPIQNTCGMIQ